jgi:alginate O-acetyltransferase complex protein AlgI
MLFNSLHFLVFFPIVAVLYFILPRRTQWMVLLAASCYFYLSFHPIYLLIPAFTITVDYFAAHGIARSEGRRRKLWLLASVLANVGALCLFKYFNFFDQAVTSLLGLWNVANPIPLLTWLAPIGLSFQVFRSLSYTIEVYNGRFQPESHFGIYALYVLLFLELIAGPIERPQNLLPQLHKEHGFIYANAVSGLQLAMFGLFKKIVIADRLAPFVAQVYDNPHNFHGLSLTLATVCFAFQLYCDFSGYTDIAIGLGQVLGLKLLPNFDRPYFSKSISEFWRRWHISLSTWLRDYVFIPLALTRAARMIESIAVVESVILVITFLVSGLWHGPAWTYVLWGGLNGVYLATELLIEEPLGRIFTEEVLERWNWPLRIVRVGFTFTLVCGTLILFRAATLRDAGYVYAHLTEGWGDALSHISSPAFLKVNVLLGQDKSDAMIAFASLALLLVIHWIQREHEIRDILNRQSRWLRWGVYYAGIVVLLFFGAFNQTQQFIYVQF